MSTRVRLKAWPAGQSFAVAPWGGRQSQFLITWTVSAGLLERPAGMAAGFPGE